MISRIGLAVLTALTLIGCHDRGRANDADGQLVIFPGDLDFARVALHGGHELEVSLRNVGRGPLGIERMWTEGPDGTTYAATFTDGDESSLHPGGNRGIRVRFSPVVEGPLQGVLSVKTDSRNFPVIRVPLTGVGVDAAARLSSDTAQFGRIEVGRSKQLPLTFTNPSDLRTEVKVEVSGPDADEFRMESFSLEPYEARTITATFAPTRVGVKDAVFVVEPCGGCPKRLVSIVAEGLDRAVVAEPAELDFGRVPIDQEHTLTVRLHNISTEPTRLMGSELATGTDASFTAPIHSFPITLGPDQSYEMTVRYSPGHMGEALGRLEVRVESARHPITPVPLKGYGGAAELCVSPPSYDYGLVPIGAKVSTTVSIRNCGADNGGAMVITDLFFADEPYIPGNKEFNFERPALPVALQPGEELRLKVFYEPTQEGNAGAFLHVRTSAYSGSLVRIGFNGRAQDAGPCVVNITPTALDFGTVLPDRGAVLGVKIENPGETLCAVKNIRLADDAGGVFFMPGGEIDGLVVWPGNYFSFQVAVRTPPEGGDFDGALQIQPSNPANPEVIVPLRVRGAESCIVALPSYLDFGIARADCPPEPASFTLTNQCAAPVEVTSVTIGPGTTDGEFFVSGLAAALPRTLQPGDNYTVEVTYLAQVPGMNLSPLYVGTSELGRPYLVPLIGESSDDLEQTDRFTQQDGSKVDVLFVVDNTASMVEEQPKLLAALPAFVDAAQEKNVDLHVAVTTTGIEPATDACPGGAMGGERGRFFPADGSNQRILTLQTPNLTAELQQNADVGQCAFVEQGLEAMRRALSDPLVSRADDPRTPLVNDGNLGFLREEAGLAVVMIGDEDDHSPDDVDTYVRFLRERKGAGQPQRASLYAIAPTENSCSSVGGTGTRYAEAAQRTGGEVMSACAPDYSPLLTSVANKAFSPQDRFPLSATPEGAVAVAVDGAAASGWSYDPGSNSVVFSPIPAPGSRIDVTYTRACVR